MDIPSGIPLNVPSSHIDWTTPGQGALLALSLLIAVAACSERPRQETDHSAHHPDGAESPYADYVEREVKALSPDEREALLAGEGMGMALAAELNGYPGPRHVLELSEDLGLDERQLQRMNTIFQAMKESAQQLGASIVRAEAELDRAFATSEITTGELERRVAEIAGLRAALRTAHLQAHLDAREVLDEVQVRRYQELRGYTSVPR